MKTLLEIIIKVILGLVIMFIFLTILINYYASKTGNIKGGTTFCNKKNYSIGIINNPTEKYLCHNDIKGKCISNIISFNTDEFKNLYFYFNLNDFEKRNEQEITNLLKNGYFYTIFSGDLSEDKSYLVKDIGDIKKYGFLDYNSCELTLYSDNELTNVNESRKENFKNLK